MRGFTLIELLLVLAIIAIVAAFSAPLTQSFQIGADLNTVTLSTVQQLRRAHQQAVAGQAASDWGGDFDSAGNSLTLFQGSSFATRDAESDTVTTIPNSVGITTDFSDEIIFAQFSGQPSASGTVMLLSDNNETTEISINNLGRIEAAY